MSGYTSRRDARMARRVVDQNGDLKAVDVEHGKYTTYCNHGCRCVDCSAAWRSAVGGRRLARLRLLAEVDGRLVSMASVAHGRAATYQNWGCRCVSCTEAERVARAARRRRAS